MHKKGLLLVFLTALISGVSIFVNAFGVKGINPFLFTGAKNLIVGIFLLSIILLTTNLKELKELSKKQWGQLGLIGLIGGSIPFLLFFKGLQLATPAQGSFVHKTMVVWVAALSILLLKEKLDKKIVVGALLLLAGNFLLLKLTNFEFTTGIALIFIATLFWASEIILSKKVLKELNGNVVAFGRMFFGSLFIMMFLGVTGQLSLAATITGSQTIWIFVTSAFLLGYVMTFYNGLKHVNASTAVAVLSLGSVVTTILNFVLLDKIVSLGQVVGVAGIIVGIWLFSVYTVKDLRKESLVSLS